MLRPLVFQALYAYGYSLIGQLYMIQINVLC